MTARVTIALEPVRKHGVGPGSFDVTSGSLTSLNSASSAFHHGLCWCVVGWHVHRTQIGMSRHESTSRHSTVSSLRGIMRSEAKNWIVTIFLMCPSHISVQMLQQQLHLEWCPGLCGAWQSKNGGEMRSPRDTEYLSWTLHEPIRLYDT